MGFTVDTAGSVKDNNEPSAKQGKPFVRDTSDNKLFTEIQVKDIRDIITEDCVGVFDFDTSAFQAASNMETKYIKVLHKDLGIEEELPNITTFKGMGKKIKPSSWLGLKNTEREVDGLPPLTVDEFEIVPCQKLKYDYEKSMEQAKIQILLKLKQVRQQFRVPKIKVVLGSGDNFRHKLPLCRPYKGNRTESLRPLLLKDIRKWIEDELDCTIATVRDDGEKIEADDRVEYFGHIGYQHYRKTGKFNYLVIASDKDSLGLPKLVVNPDTHSGENNPLRGQWKFPQAMLIEGTDRSVGNLELVAKSGSSEVKGYGLKFLIYQAILGQDQADNYNALSHLKDSGYKLDFGDQSAYKVLQPQKTPKDVIQAAVDTVVELLPYGVQYTAHDGRKMDVDSMEYMNTYFLVAYMNRSANDTTDFYKMCRAFGVDTSKVIGNNKKSPPVRTYVGNEDHVQKVTGLLTTILNEDLKGCKQLKSKEKDEVFDKIKEKLESIDFECHYEMK